VRACVRGIVFLFARTTDADHDIFNHLVSWVASAEILLTIAVAVAARGWRRRNRELWFSLAAWAAVCALLMLPFTAPLWNILPKLRFAQFPWRWLLCLGIPFSLLTTMGVRRWTSRVAIYVAMLCVLAFVWHHLLPPWWDYAPDLREMQENMATGAGYEGTDEYTPVGADPWAVDKTAPRVTVDGRLMRRFGFQSGEPSERNLRRRCRQRTSWFCIFLIIRRGAWR